MSRLQEIWQQLDSQQGMFRRVRYDAVSPCDVYLGLKMPEAERMLVLRLPISLAKSVKNKLPSQGIRIDKIADPDDKTRFFLNVVLANSLFSSLFDVLLEDLISQLLPIADPAAAMRTLINQLDSWEGFFSRYLAGGLTSEQQKGLFGELHVLQLMLNNLPDAGLVIDSWVGNEAALQDFRAGAWAVEVKTSSQTTNERITINGERQLDERPFDHLFLYYINVDVRPNSSPTLNELIIAIRTILQGGNAALFAFNRKLAKAGYFDAQSVVYESVGYAIRDELVFRVTDAFPRIVPTDLRTGVSEVRYAASLADCLPYQITQQQLFQHIA